MRVGRRLAWFAPLLFACCAPRQQPPAQADAPDPPMIAAPIDAGSPPDEPLPPLVATPDNPFAPRLRVRKVIAKADAGCEPFDPGSLGPCRAIATRAPEATGDAKSSARAAFDGDRCSVWNSGGFAPQAIRARLPNDARVSAIVLVPEMTPNGQTMHVVELAGGDESSKHLIQAALETETTYVVTFDRPILARTLTVRSARSPSWIAFREIIPLACDGAPDLTALVEVTPPTPPTPDPGPDKVERFVRGRGSCTTKDDCVPAECCHARTCNAKSVAPSCRGVGCSQNVAPETVDTGACACVNKTCGANIQFYTHRPGGGLL